MEPTALENPRNENTRQRAPLVKLSQRLWGLDWNRVLPSSLGSEGIIAETGDYDQICKFAKDHFQSIYEQDSKESTFIASEISDAKNTFYQNCVDISVFLDQGKIVGFFTCNPLDWSTYYMRNCSILPRYQGKKLIQSFIKLVIDQARKHGVSRIETDISPSNLINVHVLNKLEFNATAMQLSERWGSLVRMTKYLKEENTRVFLEQFCWGVFHQLKPHRERRST